MLSIDVKALGFSVVCRHCESEFTAKDDAQSSAAMDDPINFWINFTDHGSKTYESEPLHSADRCLKDGPHRRPR
jgi:hypothetical protein